VVNKAYCKARLGNYKAAIRTKQCFMSTAKRLKGSIQPYSD